MAPVSSPEFDNTAILYQTDGTANKYGGVEVYINTIAGDAQAYGMDAWLMVGEGTTPNKLAETVFPSFYDKQIKIVKQRFPGISDDRGFIDRLNRHLNQMNGAENYIAPFPTDDIRIFLRHLHPEIVHSMHPWQPHHGGRVDAMLYEIAKRGQDIARVGTYHIDSDDLMTNLAVRATGFVGRKSLEHFNAMLASSPVAEAHLRRTGYYGGEVQVIPNPVDVAQFESVTPFSVEEIEKQGARHADQYVVFVGRPDDRKGLGELLCGFSKLNDRLPSFYDVELVICGDGPLRSQYEAQAEELGIKNVSFVGRVSNEDKARWLKTADLAVFPAKGGESQGIVLLEAMAAGSGAVIGGSNTGYSFTFDKLPSKDLALFDANLDSGDSEATTRRKLYDFVDRMYVLLTQDGVRRDLHEEQQRLVRNVFDIGIIGRQIRQVYADTLKAA